MFCYQTEEDASINFLAVDRDTDWAEPIEAAPTHSEAPPLTFLWELVDLNIKLNWR
jgi:hypothetical protein